MNQDPGAGQEWETFSVRLTRETAERFRAVAAREHRPVAAEIRRLIEMRIDEKDPNGDAVAA